MGYLFEFENEKKLAYVSDVGSWDRSAEKRMKSADVLVIDGAMWQKKMIVKAKEGYRVVSEKTRRNLGTYKTMEEAKKLG